jgi:hypothetical protein
LILLMTLFIHKYIHTYIIIHIRHLCSCYIYIYTTNIYNNASKIPLFIIFTLKITKTL